MEALEIELYASLAIIGGVLIMAVFFIGLFMKKMKEEGGE